MISARIVNYGEPILSCEARLKIGDMGGELLYWRKLAMNPVGQAEYVRVLDVAIPKFGSAETWLASYHAGSVSSLGVSDGCFRLVVNGILTCLSHVFQCRLCANLCLFSTSLH